MLSVMSSNGSHTPAIAFFDVDNTLVRGSTMYQLAKTAWRAGHIHVADVARFAWHQLMFLLVGETPGQLRTARGRGLALIAGQPAAGIRAIAETAFVRGIRPRLMEQTVARAKAHMEHGDEVWIVTASPQDLGAIIARELGLTGALGTVVEERGGIATGRLVGEPLHGPLKVVAIRRLAAERGIDLADCSAYSDSINDLPMLSAVGHPVAVNPDAALRRHARAAGWDIVGERKKR